MMNNLVIEKKKVSFFYFLASLLFVSLGQPAGFFLFGIVSAFLGYALFFRAIWPFSSKGRFLGGVIWFLCVQSIQLSWMVSLKYQGIYILIVYAFLLISIGFQFGFLTLLLPKKNCSFSYHRMFMISAFWVIMEWLRVYFICGFTWNPAGLALASHQLSRGFASLWGIYGLSFWVILVNVFAFNALFLKKCLRKTIVWLVLGIVPFIFGYIQQKIHEPQFLSEKNASVILIQTSLLPEEKEPFFSESSFIAPTEQWRRILSYLKEHQGKKIDLIVLPEAALPFKAFNNIYYLETFIAIWQQEFGEKALSSLPSLKEPLAQSFPEWKVNNAFWAQAIANHFDAELVIGLDDYDSQLKKSYNAAFHFTPKNFAPQRYEKRVLVPLAEYLPFQWCYTLAAQLGISDFFEPGEKAMVFSKGKVPFSVSICYEETYANLIREGRLLGAQMFVNISNDVWFPQTSLSKQHFDHGILRSVENGVPLVRATNTGITGVIDSFGRVLSTFVDSNQSYENLSGAIHVQIPLYSYRTLYTYIGDFLIVGLSFLLCISYLGASLFRSSKSYF